MILTVGDKKDKSKKKSVHYCDFCKENTPMIRLKETRNIRYSPEYNKEGKEAVCSTCYEVMKKY